jgi:hypothetical protein
MKGLDQGHLHPKLEVLRLTYLCRQSKPGLVEGGEHFRKKPFEDLLIAIRNIYCRVRTVYI